MLFFGAQDVLINHCQKPVKFRELKLEGGGVSGSVSVEVLWRDRVRTDCQDESVSDHLETSVQSLVRRCITFRKLEQIFSSLCELDFRLFA